MGVKGLRGFKPVLSELHTTEAVGSQSLARRRITTHDGRRRREIRHEHGVREDGRLPGRVWWHSGMDRKGRISGVWHGGMRLHRQVVE